ncbi:MAG: hypothetical protein ABFS86_11205 [Planctomycetota bacterium]
MSSPTSHQYRPAEVPIERVFSAFLMDESDRLGDRTFKRYHDVVASFAWYLNRQGGSALEPAALDFLSAAGDDPRPDRLRFVDLFGPEWILPLYEPFFGEFLPCRDEVSRTGLISIATVLRRLATWLHRKGFARAEESRAASARALAAKRDLPLAREIRDWLWANSAAAPLHLEVLEGEFEFSHLEHRLMWLETEERGTFGPLLVLPIAAMSCPFGWSFTGRLGRVPAGWELLEIEAVLPQGPA